MTCYYQLRLTLDTQATAHALMTMVFKAVFTKSEAQTIKHPQEKRVVWTSPTRETRKHRTFIPVEVFEEPAHLKRES